jgi:hypothetical protein
VPYLGSYVWIISQRNEGSGTITIGPFSNEVRAAGPQRGHIAERVPETKDILHCRTSAGNESLLAYHSFWRCI